MKKSGVFRWLVCINEYNWMTLIWCASVMWYGAIEFDTRLGLTESKWTVRPWQRYALSFFGLCGVFSLFPSLHICFLTSTQASKSQSSKLSKKCIDTELLYCPEYHRGFYFLCLVPFWGFIPGHRGSIACTESNKSQTDSVWTATTRPNPRPCEKHPQSLISFSSAFG